LYQAAKWCSEALNGLPPTDYVEYPVIDLLDGVDPALRCQELPLFVQGRDYFNVKEFDRASVILRPCKSPQAVFLRLYSSLISIDKKANEETDGSINIGASIECHDDDIGDGSYKNSVVDSLNSKLSKILLEIDNFHSETQGYEENPFLLYLAGIIYNKKKKSSLARSKLYKSLELFPWNWGCWQELIASLSSFDDAIGFVNKLKSSKSPLASNIMFQFFEIVVLQQFYQQSPQLLETLTNLMAIFPNFNFLKVQQFSIAYHNLDYFKAETIFDEILVNDPLRLDDLDTYSNMLYVMEKRSKLSFLAQFASQIDKFRPETCCILANYHSMKGEHEKAIMYYQRALSLNKNCLSAWTLMGHEFVELKNSHAAIESYRRAVDTNPKDFRAWYGLGQAYEVLDMHLYALYYYQRATSLQPLDKRMWQALGNCYEKTEKLEDARKSFEKALIIDNYTNQDIDPTEQLNKSLSILDNGDGMASTRIYEPHICYRLAIICEKLNDMEQTYRYMKLCLDQEIEWGVGEETSKARLWLAKYSLKNRRFDDAYELAKDLNHNNAHDIEEARSIAREARSRMLK
jgi:anaphase-promoting complex subunit 8